MKPVLLVLGIFLLTGALLAGGRAWQLNHPGGGEAVDRHAAETSAGMGMEQLADKFTAQAHEAWSERHGHQQVMQEIAAGGGAFALLAFTLAVVWPKKSSSSPR